MTSLVQVGLPQTSGGPAPALTQRELDVLQRVANGASYVTLAAEWRIAEVTVRGYGLRVMRKLSASSITHAVLLACHAGILDGRPRRHGDHAGYAAHVYRGEEPCDACRAGELEYRAGLRARNAMKANAA